MNKVAYYVLDYYDRKVIELIVKKHHLSWMDATLAFITSEAHALLEDADNGMLAYSELAIFEMWEQEWLTGNIRNSACLMGS